jgi:hypothetical protein
MFSSYELTANMLFHNVPVQQDTNTVDSRLPISFGNLAALPANAGTEVALSVLTFITKKFFAAGGALYFELRMIIRISHLILSIRNDGQEHGGTTMPSRSADSSI